MAEWVGADGIREGGIRTRVQTSQDDDVINWGRINWRSQRLAMGGKWKISGSLLVQLTLKYL